MMSDVDTERLALLGQIAVMRDRLDDLEQALIDLPLGYDQSDARFEDAQGNLSLQTGALIGRLSRYMAMLKRGGD